jgi:hypothetical protein
MKKLTRITAIAFAATFLSVSASYAASITYDNSSPQEVDRIGTWDTTGNDMVGMKVTVVDSSGASSSATWAADSGAVGAGWSLTLNDYNTTTWHSASTQGAFWTFEVFDDFEADSLKIEALEGLTVFDRLGVPEYTPGSAFGWELDYTGNTDFIATYSDLLYLPGAQPLYDLYGTLTIDFKKYDNNRQVYTNAYFTNADKNSLTFSADTDNINPVPEPTTLLLFGTGLIGLMGLQKKRRKNS